LFLLQLPAFACLRGAHDLAVHGQRRYRRGEVARLLARAGFAVEVVTCRLPLLFAPMFAWRIASRSTSAAPPSDVARRMPPAIEALLRAGVKLENRLLTAGVRFPVGTSIFALARR
jgi:hypothetical protein